MSQEQQETNTAPFLPNSNPKACGHHLYVDGQLKSPFPNWGTVERALETWIQYHGFGVKAWAGPLSSLVWNGANSHTLTSPCRGTAL